MNQHLLVRYLVKKHNPSIAETLFIDDDTIWPPEGLFPLRDDESSSETPLSWSFSKVVNPDQYPSTTTGRAAVGGHLSTPSNHQQGF